MSRYADARIKRSYRRLETDAELRERIELVHSRNYYDQRLSPPVGAALDEHADRLRMTRRIIEVCE